MVDRDARGIHRPSDLLADQYKLFDPLQEPMIRGSALTTIGRSHGYSICKSSRIFVFPLTEDCHNQWRIKDESQALLPTASAMASTSMRFPVRLTHLKQCSPEGSQSGKNFLLGGENSTDAEPRAHRIWNIGGSNCLSELEKKMRVSGQLQRIVRGFIEEGFRSCQFCTNDNQRWTPYGPTNYDERSTNLF